MKKVALASLFCLACLLPSAEALVEVEAYYWLMFPDGTHALGDGRRAGTTLDLESDLGYEDPEGVPGITVIGGGTHQAGVNYYAIEMSASDRAGRDLRFGDLTFPEGTRVSSDWNAEFTRIFYRYNMGSSFARAGVIAGGQHINYDAGLSARTVGKATVDVATIMPIIGVFGMAHPLPFLGLRASAVGSYWDYDNVEASFIDIELGVELTFLGGFFAAGGFRHVDVDAYDDEDPSDLDVTLSGPMAYIGFEW